MSSTRNLPAVTVMALIAAAVGCQQNNQSALVELNQTPIIEDDAMKLRQWSQSTALVPNGQTVAGPTLFAREPRREMADYRYTYADSGVFFGNVFMLPYRFYQVPPWREVVYPGEMYPPTYTAMPPLPPEPEMVDLPAPAYTAPPTTQP